MFLTSFNQGGGFQGDVPPLGRQTEADAAGQWTAGKFVPTVAEGHSISYDGVGNSAGDWYDDATRTLGGQNDDITTGFEDSRHSNGLYPRFALVQNYPNPFNPTTVIEFSLPEEVHVSLRVYDVLGNEVAVLANRRYTSGTYAVNVDARRWSSGVYLYRLNAGGYSRTLKMLLLK